MAIRNIYTIAQKLEWGKQAHELSSTTTREEMAAKLGIATSQVDTYRLAYRIKEGLAEYHNPPNTSDQKVMLMLKSSSRKRKYAKSKAQKHTNGSGTHLVPVEPKQDRSEFYQVRIKELEYELERAHDEVTTLQKILMTVGRTL